MFFTNIAREIQLKIDKTKAHYLAQAGIKRAVHNWMISSGSTNDIPRRYRELNFTLTGNQIFKTGCQANFAYFSFDDPLTLGPAEWRVVTGRPRLQKWVVRNMHTSNSITFTKVRVKWTGDGGVLTNLRSISMGGTTVLGPGTFTNNTEVSLTRTITLSSGAAFGNTNTFLEWTGSRPASVTVNVQWTFTDDTNTKDSKTHEVLYWDGLTSLANPAGRPGEHTFCITSTGQVNQGVANRGISGFKVLKTVKATISRRAGDNVFITDWDELDKNIP